ncbi:hypothetical protein [Anaerolentibacter hominis]|uniref:hypothetical protein n=1 Tax=Anaerolentibacter hominis TaxID=3079009 RepID=UPI0031B851FC
MGEVIAARTLNELYIILDICFLMILFGVLMYTKRYMAAIVGILGGILYLAVDYGIFYLLLNTRTVQGADTFWFLLWLSMSYGFTNFVWIWLWLDKDKNRLEWSVLILSGWLCTALLSQNFGQAFGTITISRGTGQYHGVMALILFVGYALLCVSNIKNRQKGNTVNLWDILSIGILVQFAWEFVLLITGIRPQGIAPLVVNSLLETNLGLPYLYFIHRAVMSRFGEDLKRRKRE